MIYNQQLLESGNSSIINPTIPTDKLIQPANVHDIPTRHRLDILRDILSIARVKEKDLHEHIVKGTYPLYVPTTAKRISGFIIK